ncbi:hypothetical protein [Pseudomonas sp. S2_F03]
MRTHQVAANTPANGLRIVDVKRSHESLSVKRVVRAGRIIERDEELPLMASWH